MLTLPDAGQATLTATVSDAQGDKNTANNTAAATVQVGSTTTTTTTTPPSTPPAKKATAPTVTVVSVQTIQLGKKPKLHLTLKASKKSVVAITLFGPNGKTVARWTIHLSAGTKTLALALPAKARHKGHDKLRIQVGGNGKPKTVAVALRP